LAAPGRRRQTVLMLLVSSSSHIFVRDKPVHGQSVEGFGSRMNSGRKPSGSCVLSAARIGSTVLPVLLDVVCITANLAIRRGGLFCPCFGYFCPRLALCCPLPRRVLSASFAGLSTILRRLSGSVVKRLFDFFFARRGQPSARPIRRASSRARDVGRRAFY
jgi:hypothetical protein